MSWSSLVFFCMVFNRIYILSYKTYAMVSKWRNRLSVLAGLGANYLAGFDDPLLLRDPQARHDHLPPACQQLRPLWTAHQLLLSPPPTSRRLSCELLRPMLLIRQ